MTRIGTNIAIIQSGQVLLAKREDLEVWALPGGMIDPGESAAQAAIREAREETGLDVELLRLVGIYSRIGGGPDIHGPLFVGRPIGGVLKPQPNEVLELRYFAPDALPEHMLWWHRQQIADAFNDVGGSVVRSFKINAAQEVGSRQELYDLRDRSGMSRPEFYNYFFEKGGTNETSLEVGKQQ